jgi:hypothetical protein
VGRRRWVDCITVEAGSSAVRPQPKRRRFLAVKFKDDASGELDELMSETESVGPKP